MMPAEQMSWIPHLKTQLNKEIAMLLQFKCFKIEVIGLPDNDGCSCCMLKVSCEPGTRMKSNSLSVVVATKVPGARIAGQQGNEHMTEVFITLHIRPLEPHQLSIIQRLNQIVEFVSGHTE